MEQKLLDENNNNDSTWYVDNYVLLRDYYDRTVSRIAARCIRKGNIPIEDYPFYNYIIDVLEEISETGDYIINHKELHDYANEKIRGGMAELSRGLRDYKEELQKNSSPDMIKNDAKDINNMKKVLEVADKSTDPTVGAGMGMEQLMEKLLKENSIDGSDDDQSDDDQSDDE